LLVEVLRENVVPAQLGVQPPDSRQALKVFDLHCEAHFGVAAGSGRDGVSTVDGSAESTRRKIALPTALTAALGCETEPGSEATPDDMRLSMEAAYEEITALVTALDRLLLAGACERLGREVAVLAERRHHLTAADTSGLATTVRERLAARGGSLYAMKLDSILHSLNQLRANSTYVVTPNANNERAYVFKESDLNQCVEDLMRSLSVWGDDLIDSRDRLARDLKSFLGFRYQARMQELYTKRADANEETPLQYESRVKSEVADRGCKLVFEVDRLHRVIRDMKTVSRELEYRLSSEIWNKVRNAVGSLTSQLGAEIGHFRESHSNRAISVAKQMRKIRDHVAAQMAEISAENYAAQQRAQQARGEARLASSWWDEDDWDEDCTSPLLSQGMDSLSKDQEEQTKKVQVISDGMHDKFRDVARRDNHLLLQHEIQELQDRQVLSRFFYHFKTQAMRQRFEEKMQALRMTLASNKELWDRLGHAASREKEIEREFAGTAQQMSLSELKIEELRSQVEANTDQRQKLQAWRKTKARQVMHLEQKVRAHQRLGAINVEGMLQDMTDKQNLVNKLREERKNEDAAAKEAADNMEKRKKALAIRLKEKQRLKQVAQMQLEKARKEIEGGGLSEQERVRLWRGRIAAMKERVSKAMLENQKLESQLSATMQQEIEEESLSSDDDW